MATPSSSATSPSPPMAYLHHPPGPQQLMPSAVADTHDRDIRKKTVDKFLARAEVAMLTRRLRAQLAYASYKATHNIPHVPLRDLEAQSQSQAASFNRTIAAKRKAVGASHHYNNPATQGPSSAGAGSLRRGGSGTMAPPTSVSSPRTHPASITGTPAYSGYNEIASSQRTHTAQAPSLYASILAPPPTKQARTIHNPSDPPVPAPSRPTQSPKSRTVKASPRNESARSTTKSKQPNKNAKGPSSPDKRKKKTASIDKGKRKRHPEDMEVDGEMDLKAAATLTSLLRHHHRPSLSGSASSPRSSIDGSDVGSTYSHSHFAQSSTRTAAANGAPTVTAHPSTSTIAAEPSFRSQTPPPSSGGSNHQHTTPRAATDNEAASLMLFLATSPSPARPANKDSKDLAAYRALGGGSGPLRSKGRVLFPSSSATDSAPSGHEDAPVGASYGSPALSRGGESSFASSISSIGAELGGSRSDGQDSLQGSSGALPGHPTSSGFASAPAPSQLLPPALLPLPIAPTSPAGRKGSNQSPKPILVGVAGTGNSGPVEFNFHDFINASPSPSRGVHVHGTSGGGGHKSNLGLRADVGRKLFEEEQMRHAHAIQAAAAAAAIGPPHRQEERTLGAGIDLVHS